MYRRVAHAGGRVSSVKRRLPFPANGVACPASRAPPRGEGVFPSSRRALAGRGRKPGAASSPQGFSRTHTHTHRTRDICRRHCVRKTAHKVSSSTARVLWCVCVRVRVRMSVCVCARYNRYYCYYYCYLFRD